MGDMIQFRIKRGFSAFFAVWLVFFSVNGIFAASTGTTPILQQNGAGCVLQDGDYVTESGWVHQYFIEVPSGLTRLRVQLFDRDIASNHDFQAGGTWNTSCVYTLYNPVGTAVASYTAPNNDNSGDNRWRTLLDTSSTPIANGHWQLVVNMTGTGGDDTNAYGIRADDGSATSSGTELNIYAYSFVPLGRMSSTLYPWVTSGCTVDYNDFDGDSTNTISYSSRTGAVSGSYAGSANNAWLNRPIPFADDASSIEAGLWSATNALSGSNINNFYAGDYSAASPPPSAQPQGNTFRIYLQRDGGGRPSKPVVTQKLSFVSGPNPPASGSTTRVRIEIAVFNPAAQSIAFSAANLVSADIPGGGVVYDGSPVVSQGSVTGQPALGGTGSITWNPGTVAAGATATMYYYVDVTPSSSGQRLPVTGSPGANGTTATYLDETGNASQALATYTYGPLCGLAVTENGNPIPTWIAVTRFSACADESWPTVEWHTAGEAGAVGFNLWRLQRATGQYELVNPTLLPALSHSPQGGVYRLADPGAFSGEPVTYRLEEVDALGRSMGYGPFTITFGSQAEPGRIDPDVRLGREEASDIHGYRRFERERTLREEERLQARRAELQAGVPLAAAGAERARVEVRGRGLFYVTAVQAARGLGLPLQAVEHLISVQGLNLSTLGKDVAWLADRDGAGLFFYNEGTETVYSDRNVYYLERGSGLAMQTAGGGSAGPADPGQTYGERLHFEENRCALLLPTMDPEGDLWFWDYVVAGGAAKAFAVSVPAAATAGKATLAVALQGATDRGNGDDHHAIVSVNGRTVGEAVWDGTRAHAFEVSIDAGLLRDGANTIEVSGALDQGVPYSTFYVESFDLSYPRHYRAEENRLICRGDGNPVITVSGMTEHQALVLDVGEPLKPRQLTGVAPDVVGRLTFVPRAGDVEYLVSGLNAAQRPLAVVSDRPAHLKGTGHSAEYVVIAPEEFEAAAKELAEFRRNEGLKTLVVTLEDIYDAFNDGVASPQAIREFLGYAHARWGGKKVKYAVLAGKGTYDYKDHLGHGDNLVPVMLGRTAYGLCAADQAFGDVAGRDGVPEIVVGRLPAVTRAELKRMIGKIKAYEKGQGAWTDKALFVADNGDGGGDFAAASNELAGLMPGYKTEKVYLAGPVAAAREKIQAEWNAGAALISYCGHAGVNQLAAENLFDAADAAALGNGGKLPLAVMLTCTAGRFEIPGFSSLGEALLLNGNGGMAGGLLPSGAAMHGDSLQLAGEFYKAAYRGKATNVGVALLAAMKSYIEANGRPDLLNVYNWLGDPALSFK